jgi:tRNA acetyltransferase TAN1
MSLKLGMLGWWLNLNEQYGQEMYGIKPFHADKDESKDADDEEQAEDIEASIQKELSTIQDKKSNPQDRTFTSINTGIECVFFLKTRAPVNAVELTLRICNDARNGAEPKGAVRCRYINRLVPVVDIERSTEGGMAKVGREILGREFTLRGLEGEAKKEDGMG